MRDLPVSLDVLLLLLLVPAQTRLEENAILMVVPLLFYIMIELWLPLSPYLTLPRKMDKVRASFLTRLFLLFIMIAGAAVVPTGMRIGYRLSIQTNNPDTSASESKLHDGAIQTEAALEHLSNGKNPYVESYEDTELRFFGFFGTGLRNPALDHLVYLPGLLVTSFPLYRAIMNIGPFYDQRIVYLLAYLLLILLLPLMVIRPAHKLLLIAAIALNPLRTGLTITGMNDIVVILALILMAIALLHKRLLLSALFFGFACSLKQSAWFLAPFYVLLLTGMVDRRHLMREITKPLLVAALVFVIVVGPFIIWDAKAFLTDVFLYPGGLGSIQYPIRGYTIGRFLVGLGIISSPLEPFPFWILELLFGVPLLLLLLRYQRNRNNVGFMFICGGVFVFGMGLLSRFFQDNYVGYVSVLVTFGIVLTYDFSRPRQLAKDSAATVRL